MLLGSVLIDKNHQKAPAVGRYWWFYFRIFFLFVSRGPKVCPDSSPFRLSLQMPSQSMSPSRESPACLEDHIKTGLNTQTPRRRNHSKVKELERLTRETLPTSNTYYTVLARNDQKGLSLQSLGEPCTYPMHTSFTTCDYAPL